MKKNAPLFLFLPLYFLFSLPASAGNLNFKKALHFETKAEVFIQEGKTFRSRDELNMEKGRCVLKAKTSGDHVIKQGASLPVTQIISQVEVQKVTLKLGGGAVKEYELFCEIPEFPSQENLRAIVLKRIHEDKEWAQRYNQMDAQEQAESLRIFMGRAANQILDEEFDFIMSGIANLEF